MKQPWIGAEEILTGKRASFHGVLLIPAADDLIHSAYQQTFVIMRQQLVPLAAPDTFLCIGGLPANMSNALELFRTVVLKRNIEESYIRMLELQPSFSN